MLTMTPTVILITADLRPERRRRSQRSVCLEGVWLANNKGQNNTAEVGGVSLSPTLMINCAKDQQSDIEKLKSTFCRERSREKVRREEMVWQTGRGGEQGEAT